MLNVNCFPLGVFVPRIQNRWLASVEVTLVHCGNQVPPSRTPAYQYW